MKTLYHLEAGEVIFRKHKKRLAFDYTEMYTFYKKKYGINKREKVDMENYMQVRNCGLISIIFKEFFQV